MEPTIEKLISASQDALHTAHHQKVAVCITVVDQGGHIVYQLRMNDANFMTNEVSFLKAKTAFLFRCPSHALRTITEKVPVLLPTMAKVPGDVCMLEGGLPLLVNNRVVGGVGVSGGNFEQDLSIATAFVESLSTASHGI